MASERPSRRRARSPSARAACASVAASGPGGAVVALPLNKASSRKDLIAAASQIVARVGAVERLVAEREVGNEVAFAGGLRQRPLEPARVPRVDAAEPAVRRDAHAHEDVAAKGLDQRRALAGRRWRLTSPDLSRRQAAQELRQQPEAFTDLVHAHQQARIDVAGGSQLDVEVELVVGRVGKALARIEGTPRGAADEAAGRVLADQLRRDDAGGD